MTMSKIQFEMLRYLAQRPCGCTDLAYGVKPSVLETRLNLIRALVRLGYARDYGAWDGRRIPIHLRIWGITDSGKAALKQHTFINASIEAGQSQFGLRLVAKDGLTIKGCVTAEGGGESKTKPTNKLKKEE